MLKTSLDQFSWYGLGYNTCYFPICQNKFWWQYLVWDQRTTISGASGFGFQAHLIFHGLQPSTVQMVTHLFTNPDHGYLTSVTPQFPNLIQNNNARGIHTKVRIDWTIPLERILPFGLMDNWVITISDQKSILQPKRWRSYQT